MPKIKDILDNWKSISIALSALLVVVPSVINGVNDVWVAFNHLPIGSKEKINNLLFKTHWKDTPVLTKQIIIEGNSGKVPITIDVYHNGDIFVDYGKLTQWFPYKNLVVNNSFKFINSAYAGMSIFDKTSKSLKTQDNIKIENIKNSSNIVERVRVYDDGSKEIQYIDINTGKISRNRILSSNEIYPNFNDSPNSKIEVIKLPENSNEKLDVYSVEAK